MSKSVFHWDDPFLFEQQLTAANVSFEIKRAYVGAEVTTTRLGRFS